MIDAELVFRLADAITPRLRALVIVAGFVGLRTGELLGLRRCDVDLENARLTVLVQAQEVIGQGQASPRAALIYQHATERRDREIAAYLDQAIPEP